MDRKGILMAVGLGIVTVLWLMFMMPSTEPELAGPGQEVVDDSSKSNEKVNSLDDPSTKAPAEKPLDPKAGDDKPASSDDPIIKKEVVVDFKPLDPEVISFDDRYKMTVDPQKGIAEVDLLSYRKEVDDKVNKVKLGATEFNSLFLTGLADTWKYGKPEVVNSGNAITIKRSVIGKNLDVIKTITLSKDYQFKVTYKFINTGDASIVLNGLGLNCGNVRPLTKNVGMMAGLDQTVDVYDLKNEKVSTNTLADIVEKATEVEQEKNLSPGQGTYYLEKPEGGFQWISAKNRYFAWIIDFKEGFRDCQLGYNIIKDKNPPPKGSGQEPDDTSLVTAVGYLNSMTIEAGSTKEITFDCYAGPQSLTILKKMDHNKKGVMQLNLFMWFKVGWIGFISELMLNGLLWLYSFVGNYGVSIILLTIIVKVLFWRLTNKSTESMKKMSALSPKMKELNEKYKDNPQAKQQEVMKLYRENGVNPIAGCLPLFLQMPVFIALFNALRGAIELRHSEFLWIADLSQPDTIFTIAGLPIRPLAIAWAISMVIQQKVVPSTADPAQKKIMMFMPVFMLFVCYSMPSGLTLYWTFSTMMSILQYYLNNKKTASDKKEQPVVKTATG
jgi:YidC/Oxa1 family membrane protein insertase